MSKHNLDCWNQNEYLGFGLAAHSYINKVRYSNIENIENYIDNIENENFGKNIIVHEKQSNEDRQKEYMLIGLRKISGINIIEFENKFRTNPLELYKKQIKKLKRQELLEIRDEHIRLTKKGLDFANIVWEEFI